MKVQNGLVEHRLACHAQPALAGVGHLLSIPLLIALTFSCKTFSESSSSDLMSYDDYAVPEGILLDEEACATLFPTGTWVDLFASESLKELFFELPEHHSPSGGWIYEQGSLRSIAGGPYSHIATRCAFQNFEMEFDWSVAEGANSGVKYGVDPTLEPVGLEYQILDDLHNPDAQLGEKRRAGALYDLYEAPSTKIVNPVGSINHSRIEFNNGVGEHWLNDERLFSFDINSKDFSDRVEQSKFKHVPYFAKNASGHILFQHHGDRVIFSSARIRSL